MNLLRRLSEGIDRISLCGAYVAITLCGILILLVLAEIINRSVFGSSFLWTFEISSWLLVGFTFMGMGYTLGTGGHVRVTLVSSRLTARIQAQLELVLSAVGTGFIVFLAVYVLKGMISNYTMNTRGLSVLEPPMFVIWAVAFLGLCVFALQFIGLAFKSALSILNDSQGDK